MCTHLHFSYRNGGGGFEQQVKEEIFIVTA